MKINSLQRDITLKQGNSGHLSKSNNFREKESANICDRGYYNDYCGSFTSRGEAAATVIKKTFADKILTSGWFNSLVGAAEKHNVATSALIALGLAGILRPATTMALPGKKDKDDKIYASGHAMASGIMGFGVSLALTSPLDDAFTKSFEASEKLAGLKAIDADKGETIELLEKRASNRLTEMLKKVREIELQGENAIKEDKALAKFLTKKKNAMHTLMKTMPDWVIAIPRATLTIALIPPILKYVFGMEKKKKVTPQENIVKDVPAMNFVDKSVFAAFKGGVE